MFPKPKLSSPFLWSHLRIGLLGGSFNPAHEGHLHAATVAMKYLNLDAVWWLVSTGNPFKSHTNLIPLSDRIQACETLVRNNPRMIISDLEQQMGTIRSFDTITQLKNRFPKTDFIWVSGTDIAFEFHKWHHADRIIDLVPFAFVGRPTQHGLVRANLFRSHAKIHHNTLNQGTNLPLKPRDIYWLFGEPLHDISSSKLRLK